MPEDEEDAEREDFQDLPELHGTVSPECPDDPEQTDYPECGESPESQDRRSLRTSPFQEKQVAWEPPEMPGPVEDPEREVWTVCPACLVWPDIPETEEREEHPDSWDHPDHPDVQLPPDQNAEIPEPTDQWEHLDSPDTEAEDVDQSDQRDSPEFPDDQEEREEMANQDQPDPQDPQDPTEDRDHQDGTEKLDYPVVCEEHPEGEGPLPSTPTKWSSGIPKTAGSPPAQEASNISGTDSRSCTPLVTNNRMPRISELHLLASRASALFHS